MAVHRGTAWFDAPWWTVCVGPPAAGAGPADAGSVDAGSVDGGPAEVGRVQGGSYAEAHALAVKLIATSAGVAESSVTLLLELIPGPRRPG